MSEPGSRRPWLHARGAGFTLVEVLVVLLIVGLAATLVGLSGGPNPATMLEDEAERLRHALEGGFDRSRISRTNVAWRAVSDGYSLDIGDGAAGGRIAMRELKAPVRIVAVWREGVLQEPPYDIPLSGRSPGLFRIRLGGEEGMVFDLQSTLLGRIERVRGT